jgi:hypothetical protein
MKTSEQSRFFSSINKFQTTTQWKQLNDSLKTLTSELVFWLSGLRLPGGFILLNHFRNLVAAGKVVATGLHAVVLSTVANKRLYVGFGFMGIVAPLAGCMHLLFNKTVIDVEWYHLNNFYLLLLLGPFITGVFICIGVYHLFPNGSKRAYALALPMGYLIGKIIWLYQIESNEEFEQITPLNVVLVGVLISVIIFFLSEWLAWRWAHRTRAFDARLDSLDNIVDEESISDAKFRSMFRQVYKEKKAFPKQF